MKYNYLIQNNCDGHNYGHGVVVLCKYDGQSFFVAFIEGYEWSRGAKEVNIYINRAEWYDSRIHSINGKNLIHHAKGFIEQFIRGQYDSKGENRSSKYQFDIHFNA